MTQESIGKAAGIVWHHLRENLEKGISLGQLKRIEGLRPDEVVAAVGWLAREGKVCFETRGRVTVKLVEREVACA